MSSQSHLGHHTTMRLRKSRPRSAQSLRARPLISEMLAPNNSEHATALDLSVVRDQIIAYARLYERIRQQMTPSAERTNKMQEAVDRMKSLANAAFPLLPDLIKSSSPCEKLAAVSILECFSRRRYLEFLVELIRSEQPFVGYHAALALEFAVSAMEPRYYQQLHKKNRRWAKCPRIGGQSA